jgi:hypothetical protein
MSNNTYKSFGLWVEKHDKLFEKYLMMYHTLLDYLEHYMEEDKAQVCKCFSDVFRRCDEISYDEPGMHIAYVLFHFLDRYYRFQLTYLKLITDGIFPLKESINVLDIGTGPGPSMYAISDLLDLFIEYETTIYGRSVIERINIDYAERSASFRHFLHIFTELLLSKGGKCHVPFHFGTWHDVNELDFSGKMDFVNSLWINGELIYKEVQTRKVRRSFDIVVYSNFLTNENIVDKFTIQIMKSAFYLKNKGLFLLVGANPNSKKYSPVYKKVDQMLSNQKYTNKRYRGGLKKTINALEMSYSYRDKSSAYTKDFIIRNIDILTNNNWRCFIEENFLKELEHWKDAQSSNSIKWFISVYKRHSFYKPK